MVGVESGYLKIEFTFVDGDSGDERKSTFLTPLASGKDQIKAMGATLSYATKYFLRNTFLVSDGKDDPDYSGDGPRGNEYEQNKQAQNSTNVDNPGVAPTTPNNGEDKARTELKAWAQNSPVVDVTKIVNVSPTGTRNPRFDMHYELDGIKATFTAYTEHVKQVHDAINLDMPIGPISEIILQYPCAVKIGWDGKNNAPKFKNVDNNLQNKAIVRALFDEYKTYGKNIEWILSTLCVNKISDYKGTASEAFATLKEQMLDDEKQVKKDVKRDDLEQKKVINMQGQRPTAYQQPLIETNQHQHASN